MPQGMASGAGWGGVIIQDVFRKSAVAPAAKQSVVPIVCSSDVCMCVYMQAFFIGGRGRQQQQEEEEEEEDPRAARARERAEAQARCDVAPM